MAGSVVERLFPDQRRIPATARSRHHRSRGTRGTEDEVAEALEQLLAATSADEVLVHTSTFDRAARLESHRRLALLAGLTARAQAYPAA
ncbi:luciferase family oxidoreductase, group 1 [Mycobacteroides abscessus subsp. abscessus]|nr:luciferase family oxidoreductase, group 1 [Mycobacteroides abscessus subsp. abscessus]